MAKVQFPPWDVDSTLREEGTEVLTPSAHPVDEAFDCDLTLGPHRLRFLSLLTTVSFHVSRSDTLSISILPVRVLVFTILPASPARPGM